MAASEFITLSCPSCGGKLQITSDIERFACTYCGNEQVVRRGGGIVSLAPVMEGLQKVQASSDRVGAELAIQRLGPQVITAKANYEAIKASTAFEIKSGRTYSNKWARLFRLAFLVSLPVGLVWIIAVLGAPSADAQSTLLFPIVGVVLLGALWLMERNTVGRVKRNYEKASNKLAEALDTYEQLQREIDQNYAMVKSK